MVSIKGGNNGHEMDVDGYKRAYTFSVIRDEAKQASHDGEAVNINTGLVSISAETALCWVKNNDARKDIDGQPLEFHVVKIIVYMGAGTFNADPILTVIRNPTAGTMITANVATDMKSNNNAGSNNTFDDLTCLQGASGETFTDGSNHAILGLARGAAADNKRSVATFDWNLPRGTSWGFKLNPGLTSGSCNVYMAIVGYYGA
jgi:hypothetical protein